MKSSIKTIKLISLIFVGMTLVACGETTSKSNRNNPDKPAAPADQQKPLVTSFPLIDITQSNYKQVASQSLKTILLNDAGAEALNRTVNVTGAQRGEMAGVATGAIIQLLPYPCLNGGSVGFTANLRDATGGAQIDLNHAINVDFTTGFRSCNQVGYILDGDVNLTMKGNLNEWLAGTHYQFSSALSTGSLFIQQPEIPSFFLKGKFAYNVGSIDGIKVTTELSSNDSIYTADTTYQIVDFHLEKTINTVTQAYSYRIDSEFNDLFNKNVSIQYQTLEPISGKGVELPTDGLLAINGKKSSVMVYFENNQKLRLELDLNNDNQIDEVHYSDWNELVLSAFDNVRF